MKLKLFLILSIAMLFIGCSSTASSDSPITGNQTTLTGVKTCLKSSVAGQSVPAGTIAKRLSDGATATLDAKGCYELPAHGAVLARAFSDSTNDSVQLYNDSALFAITIPYMTAGDTISVSPTLVTLQDAPNVEVDSVHLIVYDKTRMLTRKVKLRVADYGDSSSYSRTLWIRDNSSPVKVHFQISGVRTFASSIISVQPGSSVFRSWNQIKEGSVPYVLHGRGIIVDSLGVHKLIPAYGKLDTVVDSTVKSIRIHSSSIYGIASMKIDGVEGTSVDVSNFLSFDGLVQKSVVVSITDSAGYSRTDTLKILRVWKIAPSGVPTITIWDNATDGFYIHYVY